MSKHDFNNVERFDLTQDCNRINILLIFSKEDQGFTNVLEKYYELANLTNSCIDEEEKSAEHINFFWLDMLV